MGRELIALACADLHANRWKQFNQENRRLMHSLHQFRLLSNESKKRGAAPVLFAGDLFHDPKEIENLLGTMVKKTYKNTFERNDIPFIAISGNHDMSEQNFIDKRSPTHLEGYDLTFGTFKLIDFEYYPLTEDIDVWGIPYINGNREYPKILSDIRKRFRRKKNILLIHTDLHGAKDTNGVEIGSVENIGNKLDKFFKGFDLVLCGHIHKPQQLGSKVYMLGALQQQSRKDMGCEMGFWEIYSDLSVKFIPVTKYPEFREYPAGQEKPDNFHYYDEIMDIKQVEIKGEYLSTDNRSSLAKAWLKAHKIEDKAKRKFLINLLNEA
jgi:DNA repair exonuclease SbcCD nuclease subunit